MIPQDLRQLSDEMIDVLRHVVLEARVDLDPGFEVLLVIRKNGSRVGTFCTKERTSGMPFN